MDVQAREKIQEFLRQQIQIRRQEKGSVVHNDLLDSFLNFQGPDGSKLTEDQVIDNLQFVLLGGHETTSNIMSWTYRNLLLHPKILELVKVWVHHPRSAVNQVSQSKDLKQFSNAL